MAEATAIRVAIADDDDDVRRLLWFTLQMDERFALVGEAADGVAAVEVAEREQPDLLILDLAMPGSSGLDVLERLQTSTTRPRVAVYSCFAGDSEQASAALNRGADMYFEKTGDLSRLLNALAEMFKNGMGSVHES